MCRRFCFLESCGVAVLVDASDPSNLLSCHVANFAQYSTSFIFYHLGGSLVNT